MIALEVWINAEKKCVAGTNGDVLNIILDAMRRPYMGIAGHIHVGGIIEKEDTSFHARWLPRTHLQLGDEIRIHLLETEEVDAPIEERRSKTQAEKDEEVRSGLISARALLPSSLQENDTATRALLDERLEQESLVSALHLLAELGELNAMPAPYWKHLSLCASRLLRYEEASRYGEREVELTPKDEHPTQPDDTKMEQSTSLVALEVWINSEKKCVAGNNDNVLNAIVNATHEPNVHVGGLMKREGTRFHVDWLHAPLQIGDEVRIRLVETDEVDTPIEEKRGKTQAERDEEVRSRLASARAMLPSSTRENDAPMLALLDERLKQENFAASMHLLAELGEANTMTAPYWIDLEWCAQILGRYGERNNYSARANALTTKDEPTPNVAADEGSQT